MAVEIHERLRPLADEAWRAYAAGRRELPEIVVEALPILYFGDSQAYAASPIRVLTVGLNPSGEEFPAADRWQRIPGGAQLDRSIDDLLAGLDGYFETKPYKQWFAWFEGVLLGLDASYYAGKARSRALHTDLCTPLATSPTWSKLPQSAKSVLQKRGGPLWHDLVRALRPHVLLVSVAARHLEAIEFPRRTEPAEIYRLERSNPYVATVQELDVDGHRCLLAFGKAALTPFQLIDAAARLDVGTRIGAVL